MRAHAEAGIGASVISCQRIRPSRQKKWGATLGKATRPPVARFILQTIVVTRRVPQPGHASFSTNGGAPIGISEAAIFRARHAAISVMLVSFISSLRRLHDGPGSGTNDVRASRESACRQ